MKNTTVIEVPCLQHEIRSMTISDIIEYDVRFASMVIGYKVYQSSRANSVYGMAIYATYQIQKEKKLYDLRGVLLSELLSNLKKLSKKRSMSLSLAL